VSVGGLAGERPADPVVPRPAATVMLLRDGDGGPEVLLLRRASSTPFVPGAHVFPGGAVDPGDIAHDDEHDDVVAGRSARDASRLLGVERGGRAFFLTAVRECVEEAGVVLAVDDADRPIDEGHPLLAELADVRTALEAGTASLADVYRRHRLRVPLDGIAYVARWITPAPSPRRYDARFFAAAMPPGQQARADGWEAVDAGWWRPTAALSDWQASRIDLIEPTIASLELLARFGTVAEAMATLHAGVTVEGSAG